MQTKVIRFSIIIPLYNKELHIQRSISSVLRQSFQDFEIVIVDDGSTDNGVSVVQSFDDFRIRLIRQANSGPGAARNTGIQHATHEWLGFLDADDSWQPDHLEKMCQLIKQFPYAAFLSCGWKISDGTNSTPDMYSRHVQEKGVHCISFDEYLKLCISRKRPVWTSVVCMKKTEKIAKGIFSTARRGEDLFAWIVVLAETGKLIWSPHVGATYHQNAVNRVSLSAPGSVAGCHEPIYAVRRKATKKQLRLLKRLSNRWLVGVWKRGITEGKKLEGFPQGLFWVFDDILFCLFYFTVSLIPIHFLLDIRVKILGFRSRLRTKKNELNTKMDNEQTHYRPIPHESIVDLKKENSGVLGVLAESHGLRERIPEPVKRFLRRFLPRERYNRQLLMADPFYYAKERPDYTPRHSLTLGIVADHNLKHKYPIAACFDLGIDYRLVDLSTEDWIERIRACPCDIYLVNPTIEVKPRRQLYDERLRVLTETFGKRIIPSYASLWLYESKFRMAYWLKANGFAAPQTRIFYDADSALRFCREADIPIVYKSDLGSGTSGVKIFRDRNDLTAFVRRYFAGGFRRRGSDPRDREWGGLMLQEYIHDAREWRMIRIGTSFFGYEKVKVGDFHSGSHAWRYGRPSDELLNLLKAVTDKGDFESMDLDVFQTTDGRLLINEMQAVFGMGNPFEMCVIDDRPGRMLWDETGKKWVFEPGAFCQNSMWNLRLQYLLDTLR